MIRYERNQTISAPYALVVRLEGKGFSEWTVMPSAWQPVEVGSL